MSVNTIAFNFFVDIFELDIPKLTKIFQNGCQGFSIDAYPLDWLDGGELLVEF